MVRSNWRRDDENLWLDVTVPGNAIAKVSVPTMGWAKATVSEGGKCIWKNGAFVEGVAGIWGAAGDAQSLTFDVGGGAYNFHATAGGS